MLNSNNIEYLYNLTHNQKDKNILKEIKTVENYLIKNLTIDSKDKIYKIKLNDFYINMIRQSAPSSLDTYINIFKDNIHTKLKHFTGKYNNTIIDIGANIGLYTFKLKSTNKNAKIIAVEPIPANFKILQLNIKSNNLTNINIINKAVSYHSKNTIIEFLPEVNTVAAQDIKLLNQNWIDYNKIIKIKTKCITLNNILESHKLKYVDLLKMDVEGAEYSILKSSEQILKKFRKIVLEWHNTELKNKSINLLLDSGFKLVLEEPHLFGDLYFIQK